MTVTRRPTIAVALASYNGERHLEEQLTSLFRQTVPPAEIVVGDDASTDRTVDLVNSLSRNAPCPVRLVTRTSRVGYVANFLSIASTLDSDYVSFCDQDDIWYHHKLAAVGNAFDRAPDVVLVSHFADVIDAHARPLGRRFPPGRVSGVFDLDLPTSLFPGFSLTVHRKVVGLTSRSRSDGTEPPDGGGFSHDTLLWAVAPCCGTTVVLDQALAAYRQHTTNLVGEGHKTVRSRVGYGSQARFDAAAAHRADIGAYLSGLSVRLGTEGQTDWAHRASIRAQRYEQAGVALRRRADVYHQAGRLPAIRAWAEALASGTYMVERPPREAVLACGKDLLRAVSGRSGSDEGE